MKRDKKVGVKDLKNNLSAYLREVRKGTRIFVMDRTTITAELHEPGAVYASAGDENPILAEWIEKGIVTPAVEKKCPLPSSPVKSKRGTARRLIDEIRDEGRD